VVIDGERRERDGQGSQAPCTIFGQVRGQEEHVDASKIAASCAHQPRTGVRQWRLLEAVSGWDLLAVDVLSWGRDLTKIVAGAWLPLAIALTASPS